MTGSPPGGQETLEVLLASENFHPTKSSGGRLLTELGAALAAHAEVRLTVLTSRPASASARAPRRERYRDVEIRRLPTPRFDRRRLLGRLVNESGLSLSMFFAALFGARPDVIVATSSPPFLAPVLALASSIRRVPFLFVMMDVYPDIAVATGHLRAGSAVYRLWDSLTRYALRRSTRIVVLGRCMRETVEAKLGRADVPIDVIHNWADGEVLRPVSDADNGFFDRHPELRGRFVVQYSGNLGRFHDFETILSAAERLRDEDRIRFVIIGEGARERWIADQVRERELSNVVQLPFQPQEGLLESLNAQDVALVTLEKGAEGLCVPSKLYPVLAVGKPVVAVMDDAAEVARVVAEEGVGFVVAQGDDEALADAIVRLAGDDALRTTMERRARRLLTERFDRTRAVEQYLTTLRRAADAGRGRGAA